MYIIISHDCIYNPCSPCTNVSTSIVDLQAERQSGVTRRVTDKGKQIHLTVLIENCPSLSYSHEMSKLSEPLLPHVCFWTAGSGKSDIWPFLELHFTPVMCSYCGFNCENSKIILLHNKSQKHYCPSHCQPISSSPCCAERVVSIIKCPTEPWLESKNNILKTHNGHYRFL